MLKIHGTQIKIIINKIEFQSGVDESNLELELIENQRLKKQTELKSFDPDLENPKDQYGSNGYYPFTERVIKRNKKLNKNAYAYSTASDTRDDGELSEKEIIQKVRHLQMAKDIDYHKPQIARSRAIVSPHTHRYGEKVK